MKKKCNNHFSQLICCGSSTSNGCETSRILQNFLLHLALHLQSDQEMEQDQLLQSSSRPKGLVQPNTNPHQNQHFFKIFHHFQDYFIMNFWHFRITWAPDPSICGIILVVCERQFNGMSSGIIRLAINGQCSWINQSHSSIGEASTANTVWECNAGCLQ